MRINPVIQVEKEVSSGSSVVQGASTTVAGRSISFNQQPPSLETVRTVISAEGAIPKNTMQGRAEQLFAALNPAEQK